MHMTAIQPKSLLLVDDHPIVRRGVKQILSDAYPEMEFGEADNAEEAIAAVSGRDWDIVLLDISMPGRGGLDVLNELRKTSPRLPIIVLSMHEEEQWVIRMLRAGAKGYVSKQTAPGAIIQAVETVQQGKTFVSAGLSEKIVNSLVSHNDKPAHERLSNREFEVLCLLAGGKTTKEVAEQLKLSIKTISTFRARVMKKLSLHTNAELVHYAIENGILSIKQ